MSALRQPFVWIVLCALAVRACAVAGVESQLRQLDRPFLISGDAEGYWTLAEHLAAGESYAVYDPPRRVHRMPGFPLLLAGSIRLFGPDPSAARWLMAVCGSLTCGLVVILGQRVFDRRVGSVAGMLCAIAPTMVGFSAVLLSETLFSLLLVLNLLVWWQAADPDRNRSVSARIALSLATGATVALATYVRPGWLLTLPVFAVAAGCRLGDWKRGGLFAAGLVCGGLLTLLPWAWRNHDVTGHWVWTTLWAGPSLYDGLHSGATGASDMRFFDDDNLMSRMSEYEVDQYYRDAAWEFVREHPGQTLVLAGRKLGRFWSPWPHAEALRNPLIVSAVLCESFALGALSLCGLWRARGQFWKCVLSAGPILYLSAQHTLFVGSLRYRVPAEYPLALLSAYGWCDWWQSRR